MRMICALSAMLIKDLLCLSHVGISHAGKELGGGRVDKGKRKHVFGVSNQVIQKPSWVDLDIFYSIFYSKVKFGLLCIFIVEKKLLVSLVMGKTYEPREKTGFLHMRKQRRRSASR